MDAFDPQSNATRTTATAKDAGLRNYIVGKAKYLARPQGGTETPVVNITKDIKPGDTFVIGNLKFTFNAYMPFVIEAGTRLVIVADRGFIKKDANGYNVIDANGDPIYVRGTNQADWTLSVLVPTEQWQSLRDAEAKATPERVYEPAKIRLIQPNAI